MKKVIITGADGFVGSNTVRYFLEHDVEVLAIDLGDVPKRLGKQKNLSYVKCDLSFPDQLLTLIKQDYYDTFIHFAWAGSAGSARENYHLQVQNAINTVSCLKIAKQLGCNRFVCAGSIMEYEENLAVHSQGSKPGMSYIYGMGKQLAHSLCKSVAANIGIDLVWPMITNAYGVGEMSPRFVNTTLRKIIKNEPLCFTSAVQNYDFVYITDVSKAFYLISEKGKPFCEYLIGSGNARPLKEFIIEMIASCSNDAIPQFGELPFTGTNLPLTLFDTSPLVTDCGFKPEVDFSKGTKKTMEWLKSMEKEKK